MDERLYKSYQNLTNIIFRISDGTEEGKSRAILLNSHIDSTLPSPGAADDAMTVGIMLDVARVLIQSVPREDWFVGWSVIFCRFYFVVHLTHFSFGSCVFGLVVSLTVFPI